MTEELIGSSLSSNLNCLRTRIGDRVSVSFLSCMQAVERAFYKAATSHSSCLDYFLARPPRNICPKTSTTLKFSKLPSWSSNNLMEMETHTPTRSCRSYLKGSLVLFLSTESSTGAGSLGMDSLVRTKTSRLNGLNVSIPCRVLTQQHRVSSTTFSCLELSCPTVSLYAWNILNTEPQIKKKSLAGELEVAQEPNQDRLASGDCSGSGYGLQLHNSYSCNHHGSILENGGT